MALSFQVPSMSRALVRTASTAVPAAVCVCYKILSTTPRGSRPAAFWEHIQPHPAQRRRADVLLTPLLGIPFWATAEAVRRSRLSAPTALVPSHTVTGVLVSRTLLMMTTVLLLIAMATGLIPHAAPLATSCAS